MHRRPLAEGDTRAGQRHALSFPVRESPSESERELEPLDAILGGGSGGLAPDGHPAALAGIVGEEGVPRAMRVGPKVNIVEFDEDADGRSERGIAGARVAALRPHVAPHPA